MQALEDGEDALGVLGIDADAVIADGQHPFVALLPGRDMNTGRRLGMELDGVPDEVLKQLRQQQFVMHYGRQRVVGNHRAALFNRRLQIGECLLEDGRAIDRLEPLCTRTHTGIGQ